jgi:putative addiction module component (TIGR02574 family)
MTRAELQEELLELPLEERLDIAQALWDSAVPQPEIVLTDEQKALLERRRASFLADPDACLSWEGVKARILSRL